MKLFISVFFMYVFFSCNTKNNKAKRVKSGKYTIEAKFINDTIIDGKAIYYDSTNTLSSIVSYNMGLKSGPTVNFYPNGIVSDSLYYSNGVLNGGAFMFDSAGNLMRVKYSYYGLPVGHYYVFESGKIIKYYFSDFEKNDLVVCKYDSSGRCRLNKFNLNPVLSEAIGTDRVNVLSLFLYLPSPPGLNAVYKIGLENEQRETKNERVIGQDRIFLDTVLSYPEKGWHYFVSTHLESQKDSINKIFFNELRLDSTSN
jgi:hypothetical protein